MIIPSTAPVGVFDSGIGGFSVLRELRRRLPAESFLYVADQHHVPYGTRSLEEVKQIAFAVADYLTGRGAKLLVVACNTASAAGLYSLRDAYPALPIVGMEPAVKPAAAASQTGVIGVLATAGTLAGEPFAGVVERFAAGADVVPCPCPGLVEMIEGYLSGEPGAEARIGERLDVWIAPLLEAGVDRLVLGCTHYPLIRPLIARAAGEGVEIVDPSDAVAAQAERRLQERGILAPVGGQGRLTLLTTNESHNLIEEQGLASGIKAERVERLIWCSGRLAHAAEKAEK